MIRIKICGITRPEDARAAADAGADAIGLIFYRKSPRCVTVQQALDIVAVLPPYCARVGVFVNEHEETVRDIAERCRLDVLQFHGDEPPEYCSAFTRKVVKVFRVSDSLPLDAMRRYAVDAWQLDTLDAIRYGGTGAAFDWSIVEEARSLGPLILSGGLNPENLYQALERVRPYAVDLSSGVEQSPGVKDHAKVAQVVQIRNTFLQGTKTPS